jgi:hypothetical protein
VRSSFCDRYSKMKSEGDCGNEEGNNTTPCGFIAPLAKSLFFVRNLEISNLSL